MKANELRSDIAGFYQITAEHISSSLDLEELMGVMYQGQKRDQHIVHSALPTLLSADNQKHTFVILNAVVYFDSIGDTKTASQLCSQGLERSARGSVDIQRKAHNVAGILCLHLCNFGKALWHFEQALRLASTMSSEVARFAILSNVVSTFINMGLLEEARKLVIKLQSIEDSSSSMKVLQLQNSLNGGTIAGLVGDDLLLRKSFYISRAKIAELGSNVSSLSTAHFCAQHVRFLLRTGDPDIAYRQASAYIEHRDDKENTRTDVVLFSARAECALVASTASRLAESKRDLIALHARAEAYSDQEDLLRLIVAILASEKSEVSQKLASQYSELFSDLIVNVKHRQFFEGVTRAATSNPTDCPPVLREPTYRLPTYILDMVDIRRESSTVTRDQHSPTWKASDFGPLETRELEASLRTSAYSVAEDWAVAADYFMDRREGHCFKVARLVGLVLGELGFSKCDALRAELASRLHDIGKIALDGTIQRDVRAGKLDEHVLRDHTVVGAALLAQSDDPVLQRAREIALHHHEWWNGCGYPDGLSGQDIPIEARVCCVVDAFLELAATAAPHREWSPEVVFLQLNAMAGVQFDPLVVNALQKLYMDSSETILQLLRDEVSGIESNSLKRAKDRMLSVVEQVVY